MLADGTDLPTIHALNTGDYNTFDAGAMHDAQTQRTRVLIAIDDALPMDIDPSLTFETLTWDAVRGGFRDFRSGTIEVPLAERRVSMPPTVVAVQDDWLILSQSTNRLNQVVAITADLLGGADSIDGARAILPESIVSFGREFTAAVDDDQRVLVVAARADGLGFESMRLDASNGALQWIDEQSFVAGDAQVSGLTISTSDGGFVLGYATALGDAASLRGALLSFDGIAVVGGGLELVSPPPGGVGGLHLTSGGGLLRASWWQRRANPEEGFDIRAAILDCE